MPRYQGVRGSVTRAARLTLLLTVLTTVWAQEASYQGPILADPGLMAIEVAPLWRDRLDSPTAVVTGSAVVYLRDGRLVATELDGGWQQWSYGAGLKGPLLLAGGLIVVADGGHVVALDAVSGEPRWSQAVDAPALQFVQVAGPTLLAGDGANAVALDLATGKPRFSLQLTGTGTPVHVGESLILWSAFSGEPNVGYLYAYDARTGQELWNLAHWGDLLAVEDDLVYLVDEAAGGGDQSGSDFTVSVLDAGSGATVAQWGYSFGGQLASWSAALASPIVLTENAVLVVAGSQLFRFARGGALRPAASYRASAGSALRVGPHRGLFFFESANHGLQAVALDDGRLIDYLLPGAQISRLDLNGPRVFVGRTDGIFKALDLTTGRVRFILRTGGTGFGQTLQASGFVVVQSSAEVLVLETVE